MRSARWLGILAAIGFAACASPSPNAEWKPDPPKKPTLPDEAPAPREDGRLPPGVRPTRYHLDLSVDPQEKTFFGRVRIGVVVDAPTRSIVLHSRGPKIQTAAISSASQKQWARATPRLAANSKQEPEELVLTVDRPLEKGAAEIDLQYEAPFAPNLAGLYRVEDSGKSYAFTQFEPNDARRAFPCFDEPGFKTPVQVSVTVPEGQLAISNMPEARRRENPTNGLVSYDFQPSPPVPTYLVAVAVGAFEIKEGAKTPVPIRVITLPGKSKLGTLALETANDELGLLAEYFGIAYPYPKLDLVAVPNFGSGAMENAGLVTFREERLLVDSSHASLDARRGLAAIMAHELAHQWFGNLVTTAWWDDLWLNEGFAVWMGTKIVERWRPAYDLGLEEVRDKQWVMGVDALASARRIRQPVKSSSDALEAFDGITYVKGGSVLTMVERWLGEETFRKGVRDYLEKHRFGNARAEDMFASLGKASSQDVSSVMASFADQTGVPLIDMRVTCPAGAPDQTTVELSQREYRPLGRPESSEKPKRWRLPVCIGWDRPQSPVGDFAASKNRKCTIVEAEKTAIPLPTCPRQIYANVEEAGYYRYRLPEAALEAAAKKAQASMSVSERVGFVGNLHGLIRSGDLGVDAYFRLVEAFASEPQHVVWSQITDTLHDIEIALVTDATQAAFERRVNKLLSPIATRLGVAPKPNENEATRLLRKSALEGLAVLGNDPKVNTALIAVAEKWLSDPKSVDADIAQVALPLYGRTKGEQGFDKLVARMKQAGTPEERVLAIQGLTGVEEPKLVERALGFALDGTIKSGDLRYVFPPFFSRRRTAGVAYAFIRDHFDALKAKLPSFTLARLPSVIGKLCDPARVDEAAGFLRPRLAKIEGADKHLSQAAELGKLCAAFRDGQRQAAAKAFGAKQ